MPNTILIVAGEPNWTRRAMHLAAAMARETAAAVTLVRMIRVAHPEYLGAGAREALLSYEEYNLLGECLATAASYGIGADVALFEYSDYVGGLRSAAEQCTPAAVFAPAPGGFLPGVARLRLWALRRSLGRPLYTLGPGDAPLMWIPPASSPGAEPNPALLPHS